MEEKLSCGNCQHFNRVVEGVGYCPHNTDLHRSDYLCLAYKDGVKDTYSSQEVEEVLDLQRELCANAMLEVFDKYLSCTKFVRDELYNSARRACSPLNKQE